MTGSDIAEARRKGGIFISYRRGEGYAPAQSHIGALYEHGNGVKQNVAQAKAWYQKAADHGDILAKYDLERLTK